MSKAFYYKGEACVGRYVEQCLGELGYVREDDVLCADIALTYILTQDALEDAYFGDNGLVQNANQGTLLIDLSASTPTFSRELNAVCVVNDKKAIEAPLVFLHPGAAEAIEKSNVACFVGGEEASLTDAIPVLEALASKVQDMGGAGSAQLGKAAYTLQAAAHIISAVEADALYRAVRGVTGSMQETEARAGALSVAAEEVLQAVVEERFGGTYTVEMFMSELSAALTAADDADLILPQAEAAMHLLDLLAVVGGLDKGLAALSLMYRDEQSCARAGLDWSRANEVYQGTRDEDDDHHHDAESFDDFSDYGDGQFYPGLGYSAN